MRSALLFVLVLVSVPALACPPMRLRKPVDPIAALAERFDDSSITTEEIAEIVKSAKWISRQRSRPAGQRARALALAAAWTVPGDERSARSMLSRAYRLDRNAARALALTQGAEPLVEYVDALDPTELAAESEVVHEVPEA